MFTCIFIEPYDFDLVANRQAVLSICLFFIDLVTMLLTRIWIIIKDYAKFLKIAKAFNKEILIK